MIGLSRIGLGGALLLAAAALWPLYGCERSTSTPRSSGSGGDAPAAAAASPADTARARLGIEGMTCGSCATTARIALERTEGVYGATVSFDSASAVVLYDPARTTPAAFIARLEEMTGYRARRVDDPGTGRDAGG